MCNAVREGLNSDYQSIEYTDNCSDETTPNIVIGDEDIESITQFELNYEDISDITGIEYFTNLAQLELGANQISDISPLSGLSRLTELQLSQNQISDLTPLSQLKRLERLGLLGNPYNNIDPILLLDIDVEYGIIGDSSSSVTTNDKVYELPSLFQLIRGTLDVPEGAGFWVTLIRNTYSRFMDWDFQNAIMNEDGKSITIEDINEPAVISVHMYSEEAGGDIPVAQLTITYEEPEPTPTPTPTPTPDDPSVPNTGENNKVINDNAILNILSCIVPATIMMGFVARRFYRKHQ